MTSRRLRFATFLTSALLLVGALGFTSGWPAGSPTAPPPVTETFLVRGWLTATGFSAACRTPGDRARALTSWVEARQGGPFVTSLVRRAFAETPGCRVLAFRAGPNLIVTAGKNFLVDAWQNSVELEIMKYHGVGIGTAAAVVGDTALQTESTTILNPDSTRATGSLAEGASANIFRSVGTVSFDGSGAITEWGLFSQAATGGGTLWSRVVFAAINVASGDSIQFTYEVTIG